jgi:hypothetical protein
MFPPSSSGPITATACCMPGWLLLALRLGHGGFAWGGVQQPKARVVLPGRCCVAQRVRHALISWHAHANDCCRLPYRRTRHALWRGSPRRPLLSFPTQWCWDGLSPAPVPCGVSAHHAVSMSAHQAARSVVLLQRIVLCCNACRGSRHCYACRPCTNAWKKTGYVLKENSKVNGPKF